MACATEAGEAGTGAGGIDGCTPKPARVRTLAPPRTVLCGRAAAARCESGAVGEVDGLRGALAAARDTRGKRRCKKERRKERTNERKAYARCQAC
jgi:hypothetical protein